MICSTQEKASLFMESARHQKFVECVFQWATVVNDESGVYTELAKIPTEALPPFEQAVLQQALACMRTCFRPPSARDGLTMTLDERRRLALAWLHASRDQHEKAEDARSLVTIASTEFARMYGI